MISLALYRSQADIEHSQLTRIAHRESLVSDFSSHYEHLNKVIKASEKHLRLAQALRPKKSDGNEAWPLIARTIQFFNVEISEPDAQVLAKLILAKAKKYKIDPLLMTALVSQESAFYEKARSPVGAYGYGQLMPGTAEFLGVDPMDPEDNLEGCAKYLSQQLNTWQGHEYAIPFALASYNAGPGAVASYGGIPPYRETITYVQIIAARYDTLVEATSQSKDRKLRF